MHNQCPICRQWTESLIRSSPFEHADPSLFIAGVIARDCLRNALRQALGEGEVTNATANAKIKRLADLETSQGSLHGHESKALKSSCVQVLFRSVQSCSVIWTCSIHISRSRPWCSFLRNPLWIPPASSTGVACAKQKISTGRGTVEDRGIVGWICPRRGAEMQQDRDVHERPAGISWHVIHGIWYICRPFKAGPFPFIPKWINMLKPMIHMLICVDSFPT